MGALEFKIWFDLVRFLCLHLYMQAERKKKKGEPYAYKRTPGLVGNGQ